MNPASVRRLAEPDVLKSAAFAALISALLSYPRLALWSDRTYNLWYLESLIFLGTMVLWGFVFAWHTHYTGRPVLTLRIGAQSMALATLAGVLIAVLQYIFADPVFRARVPDEYPDNFTEWIARTLFNLSFLQLFFIFAPFAWLMRLFQHKGTAIALTVLFGIVVLLIQVNAAKTPFTSWVFAARLAYRIVSGLLAVYFYLRGGVLLVWWWALLIQARHILHFL